MVIENVCVLPLVFAWKLISYYSSKHEITAKVSSLGKSIVTSEAKEFLQNL